MSKKDAKSSVIAFKAEKDLAEFLDKLPNKSEFIRRAVYAQLGIACPVCQGTGTVSKEEHDRFEAFLDKWDLHHCNECGDEFALPKHLEDAAGELRSRLIKIQDGAHVYCFTCAPGESD